MARPTLICADPYRIGSRGRESYSEHQVPRIRSRSMTKAHDTAPSLPLCIIGCTACGKGSVGRELARRIGGEIISIDSMKVYRRMDVGTAKPSVEIRREIPHHGIDVVEPSEVFSAARFVESARQAMAAIQSRNKRAVLVGGTVLYLRALTEGLFAGPGADPTIRARLHGIARETGSASLHERLGRVDSKAAGRIHPNDLRRIVRALEVFELTGQPISTLQSQWDQDQPQQEFVMIGLRRPLEEQSRRINERVRRMIRAGLVDEVKALLAEPEPLSGTARQAVGYAEIIEHLEGRLTLADAVEMIKINTRQFAKAQRTWFKRLRSIEWVDLSEEATADAVVDDLLARRGSTW